MNQQYYNELKESVRDKILWEKYFCGVNSPTYITLVSHLHRLDNGQMSYDEMEELNYIETIQSHEIIQTLQPFLIDYSGNTATCNPHCYLSNDFKSIGIDVVIDKQIICSFSIKTVSESHLVFLIKKWSIIVENIKKIYAIGYKIYSTYDNNVVRITGPTQFEFKQIDLTVPFVE